MDKLVQEGKVQFAEKSIKMKQKKSYRIFTEGNEKAIASLKRN